jgi:predicted Zn-dependent protease
VSDLDRVVRALAAHPLSDWVVVEHAQERAIARTGPALRRAERRTRWLVTVYVDTPHGRGTGHVAADAANADPDELVARAAESAGAALAPSWTRTPPAAPAKVELADPALAGGDLLELASAALRRLPREARDASLELVREEVSAVGKQGFHAHWLATSVRGEALVVAAERSLAVAREARRFVDLELDSAVQDAARDLPQLAAAGAPAPGRCAVVLDADAMLHGGLGVWQVFVDQADAALHRRGLARYREGAPVAPGADTAAEPLTIASDGALAFGVRSTPLGDRGEAVRRFALVDRGLAADVGLSPHEAALRGRDPNGGVRNLVVAPGTWSSDLPAGRTIELRRLRDLSIDPYTGEASLSVALGIDRPGGAPFTGGTVRLDLVAALALARRAAARIRRGAYVGPARLLVDGASLVL